MLTQRQFEILLCVTEGLCQKEIAPKFHIEVRTVKFHMGRIYEKLGLLPATKASSISAVAWWARNGAPKSYAEYCKLNQRDIFEVEQAKQKIIQIRRSA